jgi:hypothetical protein
MLWLLSFFPGLLIHLLLLAGGLALLVSYFLGPIPFVKQYTIPIRVLGYVLVCFGLYYEGGLSYKKDLDLRTAKVETKIAVAAEKSASTNTQIQNNVDAAEKIIHEKGDDIIKYIDREVVKYDNACVIPQEVIKAHNLAATINAEATEAPSSGAPQ